jgi:hypothetical protein
MNSLLLFLTAQDKLGVEDGPSSCWLNLTSVTSGLDLPFMYFSSLGLTTFSILGLTGLTGLTGFAELVLTLFPED